MSNSPRKTAKVRSLISEDDALKMMLSAADQITENLTRYGRKYRALGEHDEFPEDWARKVRAAIANGLVDWAARRMGKDLETYLAEGVHNYLALFWLASVNPLRDQPRGSADRFTEDLSHADFRIPLKSSRRAVHPQEWLRLWEVYREVLQTIKRLQTKKKRSRGNYLLALRENLPGISDKQIEKFSLMKPSNIAAVYVSWKFKLPAGPDAIKEYFKVFDKNYGYFDQLADQLYK